MTTFFFFSNIYLQTEELLFRNILLHRFAIVFILFFFLLRKISITYQYMYSYFHIHK